MQAQWGAPALGHILPRACIHTIPYRVDGHGDPEGRDFRVELGKRLVSVSRRGGSVRGPGQMIPSDDFIDFMVSCGVCTEDVDLGTIVSGSLEDDSRRLCSVREKNKGRALEWLGE